MMRAIWIFMLLVALGFSGCHGRDKQADPKKPAATRKKQPVGEESADVDFQAFIGRLRKAAQAHDVAAMSEMMTTDFGYRLNPEGSGAGVFQFWDETNLWPEVQGILSERFLRKDEFMVAPPQFAAPGSEYEGYRAGMRRQNGSWKFAYFVNG